MYIQSLSMQNIGPFKEASMVFYDDPDAKPNIVLITGFNGTGKSVVLDAVRGMFGRQFCTLHRNIRRKNEGQSSRIKLGILPTLFESVQVGDRVIVSDNKWNELPTAVARGAEAPNWVVDYWSGAAFSQGPFQINALTTPNSKAYLKNALSGKKSNADMTALICHIDYLRGSTDPHEKAMAERLFSFVERIFDLSLENGTFSHVARSTMEPMIIQNGQTVGLANLCGGGLYLIRNLLSMLGKMYAVHLLRRTKLEELGHTPGFLLIDKAETGLHPHLQQRLFRNILALFPNLQIIATTHSPFMIASARHARIFVCRSMGDHCIVVDETTHLADHSVDELMHSSLFT